MELSDAQILVVVNAVDYGAHDGIPRVSDDVHHSIVHLGAYRESEQDNLHDRHHQHDQCRTSVPEDVPELLLYECKYLFHLLPAILVNTSSMSFASYRPLSSAGEPSASILPSTITDTLSQYSASSI